MRASSLKSLRASAAFLVMYVLLVPQSKNDRVVPVIWLSGLKRCTSSVTNASPSRKRSAEITTTSGPNAGANRSELDNHNRI
ncbi:unnamed protein product, partial [Mesorhabditis belari]|uniref:Secreted protein n=1 Tax=Mesorhabditis belari TaxID=2138241 RepID=A0AAF3F369_9BILA